MDTPHLKPNKRQVAQYAINYLEASEIVSATRPDAQTLIYVQEN